MKTSHLILLGYMLAVAFFSPAIHAQTWNGLGVSGGTGDNDLNNLANWTNSTNSGPLSFTGVSTSAALQFSSTTAINASSLNFGFSGTNTTLALGTGIFTAASGGSSTSTETINLTGSISMPTATGVTGNVVALGGTNTSAAGSDLILNLAGGSSNQSIGASTTSSNSVLLINAKVTGNSAGWSLLQSGGSTVWTNDNNSFTSKIGIDGGNLFYTSISASGAGNSALGSVASTASANAIITMGASNGTSLVFVGDSTQTTDRKIAITAWSSGKSAVIANASTAATTLSFTGNITESNSTNNNTTLKAYASSGNTLVFGGVISDGSLSSAKVAFSTINGGSVYYSGTGWTTVDGSGTVILSGNNTYTGGTTVNAGKLFVNNTSGSGTGTGSVTVKTGATLGGIGTVMSAGTSIISIENGGILAPGNGSGSTGTLTIDASNTGLASGSPLLTLASGATVSINLASSFTASSLSLTSSYSGEVLFNGNTINFTDLTSGNLSAGLYTLFVADTSNVFSGLTLGAANDHGGYQITGGLFIGSGLSAYSNTYLELNGSAIQLAVVPEPGSISMILIAGMFFICMGGLRARCRGPAAGDLSE